MPLPSGVQPSDSVFQKDINHKVSHTCKGVHLPPRNPHKPLVAGSGKGWMAAMGPRTGILRLPCSLGPKTAGVHLGACQLTQLFSKEEASPAEEEEAEGRVSCSFAFSRKRGGRASLELCGLLFFFFFAEFGFVVQLSSSDQDKGKRDCAASGGSRPRCCCP